MGAFNGGARTGGPATVVTRRRSYAAVYIHHVHGRLRMQIAELRRDQAANFAMRRQLYAINGVTRVTTNAVIGSVTVEYDRQACTCQEFADALCAHGVDLRSSRITVADAVAGIGNTASSARETMVSAVAQTLFEAVLRRAVRAIF